MPIAHHRAPDFSVRAFRIRSFVVSLALAFGVAACGGSDPSGPNTSSVATVVLAGVPSAAMRVGGSAQLQATTLSATGSLISGADVAWKSSDESVAAVSPAGVVTARAAGRSTITATSGSGTATAEILVVAPLTLAAGSTATLPDGSLSVTAAPGSFTGSVTLLVGPGSASLADDKVVPGTIYQISVDGTGTAFFPGTTITLRFDPARLPTGTSAGGLQLYNRTASGWTPIRRSVSNVAQRVVTGSLTTVGTYAARFTPVDRLLLSGAQVDGALYVGQTTRLGVAAVSAVGDTLASSTPTWSSSSASVARIDAQGTVTAVGPGTATLTATADGVTATTTVQVIARPVASWPGTLDWTTFRANNRRSGYVDATLDPVVFTRRWEVTLSTAVTLNEPATGDGNVYVSSNAYFGAQALWALESATGNTRWTRAFGDIHSVNGPATGNGRVYVSTGGHEDSFLWSFDAADGTVKFRSPYGNQWSRWQAPAVTSDVVFVGGGYYGGMSAFGALDGAVLWRRDLPQEDTWTPAADGGKAYAFGYVNSSLGLLSLDGRTGAATIVAPNLGVPSSGTPVIGGNSDIYAIRGSRLLQIDLNRNVIAWDRPGAYQGVPTVDGENVYAVVNNQVEARRRTDGSLVWTWVPQSNTVASGSVIVTRNLLFVRVGPSGFSTTGGRLVALDLATRRIVWSYDADGEFALGNGLLVITSRTGAKVTAISVR
jgi:hypothetical protein